MARSPKNVLIAAAVITALAIVIATGRIHYIRLRANDADLLWNGREAYVVVRSMRQGWQGNYLQWAQMFVTSRLGLVAWPTESRRSTTVFRITPAKRESYVFRDQETGPCTIFENQIYCHGLWRWAGDQFEQTTVDERRRFDSGNHPSGEWSNVDGWSRRCCLLNRRVGDSRFPIEIDGERLVVIAWNDHVKSSIQVAMPNGVLEKLWSLDGTPRRVRRHEYDEFLR
jgi:hypothetical protein